MRTWGGKTADGTDPDDPTGKKRRKAEQERAEAGDEAAEASASFHSGPVEEAVLAPGSAPEAPPPAPGIVPDGVTAPRDPTTPGMAVAEQAAPRSR